MEKETKGRLGREGQGKKPIKHHGPFESSAVPTEHSCLTPAEASPLPVT